MISAAASTAIIYPESDGLPLADNTLQLGWIITLVGNLTALFRDRADVFVGGNQFWYPVKGEPEVRAAPDTYVVFGRPKGERSSYRQWEEGDVPMTVVFEVLSPGNSGTEMVDKQAFYDEHGAEEYYLYNPDNNRLHGYGRRGDVLARIRRMNGFVSPRLGIRFDLSGPQLVIYRPDGRPFLTFEELDAERERTERWAARLAELSRKALRQEATDEERHELERLLDQEPAPES